MLRPQPWRRPIPPIFGWARCIKQTNTPVEFEQMSMLAATHNLRIHTSAVDKLYELLPIFERVHAIHEISRNRWVVEHIRLRTH